eukprot:scaffold54553_cov30-Tisochrysis_lutea.AAC.2
MAFRQKCSAAMGSSSSAQLPSRMLPTIGTRTCHGGEASAQEVPPIETSHGVRWDAGQMMRGAFQGWNACASMKVSAGTSKVNAPYIVVGDSDGALVRRWRNSTRAMERRGHKFEGTFGKSMSLENHRWRA